MILLYKRNGHTKFDINISTSKYWTLILNTAPACFYGSAFECHTLPSSLRVWPRPARPTTPLQQHSLSCVGELQNLLVAHSRLSGSTEMLFQKQPSKLARKHSLGSAKEAISNPALKGLIG